MKITELAKKIPEATKNKDIKDLHYIVHSIKGMASNVGFYKISSIAQDILQEIKIDKIPNESLNLLEIKLKNSIKLIKEFVLELKVEDSNKYKNQDLNELLERIKKLIESNSFITNDELLKLEGIQLEPQLKKKLLELKKAIENFDYDLAIEIIEKIKSKGDIYDKNN